MASLYDFQKTAVDQLLAGKHIVISTMGSGKTAMAMKFAEDKCKETGKNKLLVVTTASKVRVRNEEGLDDFSADAKLFCSPSFSKSLSSFSLLSWHKLAAWVNENWESASDYVIIFDELAKAGAGVSSGMGRAFLKLTKCNPDWAGFTGTPGDTWLKLYPFFQASGLVRNKTTFMNTYAIVQTYKGYPEVVGWRYEDRLKEMWAQISYAPDTSKVMAELPSESHKVITFAKPKTYSKTLKTRYNEAGEFLDTAGALVSELRRLCFTKDKQEWVRDFVESLDSGAVMFYNFVKTGDKLEEIIRKALPKGAKVWRVDGAHHDIPTATTLGERDVILCQWQSGSEGLNLQMVHQWVSIEACYSYSTSVQARGRIKRIGQRHRMCYFYLKVPNTIEDDIYKCLHNKSDFAADVWCASNNITMEGKYGDTD